MTMNMRSSSPERAELARSGLSRLLQAASGRTEDDLANATGMSSATVHRLKAEHAEGFCHLLSELDLKIVRADRQCYPPGYVESLKTLAEYQLRPDTPTPVLVWE